MIHPVETIVEAIRTLLIDETAAQDRVTRDRSPRRPFQGKPDLPAIDIRIGDDDPFDLGAQPQGIWRSEVTVFVDLYSYAPEIDASAVILSLRAEVDRLLMTDAPALASVVNVLRIVRNGAEPIVREEAGQVPLAYCRTAYTVLYQHSLTDPTQ